MRFKGSVLKYGDNIDTDAIIPARYLVTTRAEELAPHCLEGIDEGFAARVSPGDILVAGENFGCGSSREHAPLAIKGIGIAVVVAASFARIFFRNAINIGLPILECPLGIAKINEGDELEVNLDLGIINNLSQQESYQTTPFPPFMQELIKNGGLMNYIVSHHKQA